MRRWILIVLVALASASCSGDDPGGASVVMTRDQKFDPEELTITAGDTVTWTNDSSQSHTVTAYQDGIPEGGEYFASGGASSEDAAREQLEEGLIDAGETFETTFEEPGTYAYFCIPHEAQGMIGTIVVEE